MTRSTFLPFHQPDLDGDELAAIQEVLESGWLTTGAKTSQFERAFAAYVGAKQAVAVNSCTAAMHLALEAVGTGPGEAVVTSPYTFAATAEVIRYFDAVPVFVDVEQGTLNMDPVELAATLARERAAGRKVRAVIPVHIAGHPCDMDRIYELAEEHGSVVIEDAAHALPTRYKGRLIGGRRGVKKDSLACFSFYATKTLTTGEGGMITTENEVWAERCRVMSMHGISKDAYNRYTTEGAWHYQVVAPGFKYNLSDLAAAMGLTQLGKLERMWRRRAEIAAQYTAGFEKVAEVEAPVTAAGVEHAWHLYIVRLNLEALEINRARFIQELKRRNIGVSVHFIPLHVQPYYVEMYGYRAEDYPVAYGEYLRAISLPIYSTMTYQDVKDVIEAVSDIVAEHRKRRTQGVELPASNKIKG